jgi:hypothetical protein
MGNSIFARQRRANAASRVTSNGCIENKGLRLAPRVGFEPTTLRLTAYRLVAASRCKHEDLRVQEVDFSGNWGDSGGTLLFNLAQLCPSRLYTCSIFVFTAACMAASSRPARTNAP